MSVATWFNDFCNNLVISNEKRSSIANRFGLITRRLNIEYYGTESKTQNSRYVGSYGRGTAIKGFSDMDMIFRLPYSVYERFNNHSGNGQSALLQEVRLSIKKTYTTTNIGGDGQVIQVPFDDGITFEVVPVFINKDNQSYTYPDSNNGGSWRTTNPVAEINAISTRDSSCNDNLKRLCKMLRCWKDKWNVPMGGLLIDTFSYKFIDNWEYKDKSYLYYDFMSRDFFKYLSEIDDTKSYFYAVGSNQWIKNRGIFSAKAKKCYNLALEAITKESNGYTVTAKQKWREIYGTKFPI